jgi:hypothetical protein
VIAQPILVLLLRIGSILFPSPCRLGMFKAAR